MLKISHAQPENHAVTLKLEGRVIGPWVAELNRICRAHLVAKRVLNLDFADVTFADRSGLELLLHLRSEGVRFVNCSPFIEEELRSAPEEQ